MNQAKEVIFEFKINIQPDDVFSRCMHCNCDEFILASKIDMINLKYPDGNYPENLKKFMDDPEKYDKVEELRVLKITRYQKGQTETKYGAKLRIMESPYDLERNDEFFLCENCGKAYWIGSHYDRALSGKFRVLFNLFPKIPGL
jgi:hypothetical protein